MMFLSHLLFGALVGYFGCGFLACSSGLLFVAVTAAAAILPDIDVMTSKISRKLPPFAIVASFFFGHRGLFHSVLAAFLLYFVAAAAFNREVAAAVLIGYVSHLLLDALTTKGIRPFAPLLKFRISGFIRTNGLLEKFFLLLMVMAAAVLAMRYA